MPHKKYEFGSKVAFSVGQKSNVIKAAVSFRGNPNDNQTVEKTLAQQPRLTGKSPPKAYVDRGIKSQEIGETQIIAPSNGQGKSPSEKAKIEKRISPQSRNRTDHRAETSKSDCGMERNYLKGEDGDQVNAIFAGSAFNAPKLAEKSR